MSTLNNLGDVTSDINCLFCFLLLWQNTLSKNNNLVKDMTYLAYNSSKSLEEVRAET